ncbi:hypothetical protein EZV62_024784 [Acer yangbiense]|uniref:Uncharacterized protein n=1 Tax=Acer yangbiense TaxID=1000413 RepID=A0A5C7GWJ6_9ROSI|nr:hypothetical protein EZV62_024784 [Acer yangbiense]
MRFEVAAPGWPRPPRPPLPKKTLVRPHQQLKLKHSPSQHEVTGYSLKPYKAGGVFRMKEHLTGIQGNVVPCTRVTPEVREEIKTYMLVNENAKKRAQLMREERIDNCVTINSLSKKSSSSGIVIERGVRGLMDRFVVNVENDVVEDLGGKR